jgi:hypothetical protein
MRVLDVDLIERRTSTLLVGFVKAASMSSLSACLAPSQIRLVSYSEVLSSAVAKAFIKYQSDS